MVNAVNRYRAAGRLPLNVEADLRHGEICIKGAPDGDQADAAKLRLIEWSLEPVGHELLEGQVHYLPFGLGR